MSVAFVSYRSSAAVDGAETVIGVPDGAAAGDMIIAGFSAHNGSPVIVWGTGSWTRRFASSGNGSQVWLTVLTADDVSRGTFTVTATGDSVVMMLAAFSGAGTAWVAGTTGSLTAPSVTGSVGGDAVRLWLIGRDDGTPFITPPAGVTERVRVGNPLGSIVLADNPSGAVTGAKTATKGGPGRLLHYSGVTVLLGGDRPPVAPAWLSPPNGTIVRRDVTNRLSWRFSDPDSGDASSQFDLRFKWGDSAWTAWQPHVSTASFYDVPGGTFGVGDFQVQVRVYDKVGVVSPASASLFLTGVDPIDTPSITAPDDGGTVTESFTVEWSYPTQDAYQLRRIGDAVDGSADTGTVYFDTGEVDETDTRSLTVAFPVNDRFEHIEVRVKTGLLWSDWVDVRVLVSYTPPPSPTLRLVGDNAAASITVTIVTPDPAEDEPAATSLLLQASPDGGATVEWSRLLPDGVSGQLVFSTPATGVDYWFCATAAADNGAVASSGWVL